MKKMIIHGFRYLLVAKQIVEFGGITTVDFSVANDYYRKIMAMDVTCWEELKPLVYDTRYRT